MKVSIFLYVLEKVESGVKCRINFEMISKILPKPYSYFDIATSALFRHFIMADGSEGDICFQE